MGYTEREREIMEGWPVVTEDDVTALNNLFKHYIFYRKETIHGRRPKKEIVRLWTSCCARKEICDGPQRVETPEYRELMRGLSHNTSSVCPWCGRSVIVINLNQSGRRKGLREEKGTLLETESDNTGLGGLLFTC